MSEYLFENPAYPIVNSYRDVLPALRDPFCRAVTLRDPELAISPLIEAVPNPDLARKYGRSYFPMTEKSTGQILCESYIFEHDIKREAEDVSIEMDAVAVSDYVDISNHLRDIFIAVFEEFSGLKSSCIRGIPLFAPVAATGRAPHLHVDNNILTLHWSAALARLSIANGEPGEKTWKALDAKCSSLSALKRLEYLERAVHFPEHDMRDNEIGDVVISKGQKLLNLANPKDRKSVCVHSSSSSIAENGQVAFLLAPKLS